MSGTDMWRAHRRWPIQQKTSQPINQPGPAFGDSIGAMFIAGAISTALLHRERTGEAVEIDVSLLSTAWWAAGASVTQGMETGETMRSLMPDSLSPSVNPFMGNYQTSDGGTINLCIVSPTGYIRDAFEHLGHWKIHIVHLAKHRIVQTIQTHRHSVQSGVFQALRFARQQSTVGGEGDVERQTIGCAQFRQLRHQDF